MTRAAGSSRLRRQQQLRQVRRGSATQEIDDAAAVASSDLGDDGSFKVPVALAFGLVLIGAVVGFYLGCVFERSTGNRAAPDVLQESLRYVAEPARRECENQRKGSGAPGPEPKRAGARQEAASATRRRPPWRQPCHE